MKFVLASGNAHKLSEIRNILGNSFEIISMNDTTAKGHEVIEDGTTFEENAEKKALEIMKITGLPTIADDSGLCVDALGGAPGIYTARYAGENATNDENIDKLLANLQGVPFEKRGATFVAVIAVAFPNGTVKKFRGEVKGKILTERQGANGFGYDPVFFIEEHKATMAELDGEVKNSLSHRFNALKKMAEELSL
ncbi:MAG: XTP/dITP diphosphatase [Clostridia bacterium]|nr:XTP/dITP diphosphatase [Clostridia bacterium]